MRETLFKQRKNGKKSGKIRFSGARSTRAADCGGNVQNRPRGFSTILMSFQHFRCKKLYKMCKMRLCKVSKLYKKAGKIGVKDGI